MAVVLPEILTLRVSRSLLAKVDALAEELRRAFPGASLGRSDAARLLLEHADVGAVLAPGTHPGAGALVEGR